MTEQPLPVAGHEDVFPALIADIEARAAKGEATYGRRLQTRNGRNALQDAYEEALDMAAYLKQAVMEQAHHAAASGSGNHLPAVRAGAATAGPGD